MFLTQNDARQYSITSINFQNKPQFMLSYVWMLLLTLVVSLTTDIVVVPARDEDLTKHGSGKLQLTWGYLPTLYAAEGGRNNPGQLCMSTEL